MVIDDTKVRSGALAIKSRDLMRGEEHVSIKKFQKTNLGRRSGRRQVSEKRNTRQVPENAALVSRQTFSIVPGKQRRQGPGTKERGMGRDPWGRGDSGRIAKRKNKLGVANNLKKEPQTKGPRTPEKIN